jgi:nucleoside phosphorylase
MVLPSSVEQQRRFSSVIEQGLSLSSATIGILTVLPEEFTAACHVLGCNQEVSADGRIYRIGTVRRRDNQGAHVVVVGQMLEMGTNTAATSTALLSHDCRNVREVIMCGIAGAIPNSSKPSAHVRLGDIVVSSDGIVQYDFVRESERRTEIQEKRFSPSRRLLAAARLLQADENGGARPWNRYIAQAIEELSKTQLGKRWKRPPAEADRLREFSASRPGDYLVWLARSLGFSPNIACYRSISHPPDPERIEGTPRVFLGVIASANNLQKNPARRDELRSRFRAMAVEMEGTGVAAAAYHLDRTFLVIRGTCDYCNADKNDDWHYYAAIIAAAYTRALLEAVPLLQYLGESAGGALPAHLQSERVESVLSAPVSGRTSDEAISSKEVENAVQRHLERALVGVLEDQAKIRLNAIVRALDAWEFQEAINSGDDLCTWVAQHAAQLSSELLVEVYGLLARIAIVKATRCDENGAPPDLSQAERFLAKAKDVAGQ